MKCFTGKVSCANCVSLSVYQFRIHNTEKERLVKTAQTSTLFILLELKSETSSSFISKTTCSNCNKKISNNTIISIPKISFYRDHKRHVSSQ